MVELREPPVTRDPSPTGRIVVLLLVSNLLLALLAGAAGWRLLRDPGPSGSRGESELRREVASRLEAVGAHGEAAAQYEAYLAAVAGGPEGEDRARLAYGLGSSFLELGQYDRALRWLYEAQALEARSSAEGAVPGNELGSKIVQALERSGRSHAARAALGESVRLDADREARGEDPIRPASDPVVARIGRDEIRRSQIERRLDRLPPEAARSLGDTERQMVLRQLVADELLWRRAQRLEYERDAEVLARHAELLRELTVARYLELDVASGIAVDPVDLEAFFAANAERYRRADDQGQPRVPSLAEVRDVVTRDYRNAKLASAVESLVEEEFAAAGVELFPERMVDGR